MILSTIALISKQVGVNGLLLLSICSIESNLNPKAIHYFDGGDSHSIGLCQVKVGTAHFFDKRITEKDLLDPKINARIAAKYLKKQLDRYDGDVYKALAAYNAGTYKPGKGSAYVSKVMKVYFAKQAERTNLMRFKSANLVVGYHHE